VALNEVEPLVGLSRGEGWVLILTHVHNWRLSFSTHDATSIDVYSSTMMYTEKGIRGRACNNLMNRQTSIFLEE
jgi:hypothetical protein